MRSMKSPWKPKVKVQTIIVGYVRNQNYAHGDQEQRMETPEQRQQCTATGEEDREWQHLSRDSNAQLQEKRAENEI